MAAAGDLRSWCSPGTTILFAFVFPRQPGQDRTARGVAECRAPFEGVDWGVLFAATTLHLLPVLVFVVLMQRRLVDGLTAGSTKG